MEQKKFMDIERLKESFIDGFQKGDYIVVQEKNRRCQLFNQI